MVVDVALVQGYEDVLITLAGGDGETTGEVGSRPLPPMPCDRSTVLGKRDGEGSAGARADEA